METGDADTLVPAIICALEEDNLSLNKLVGIGTDNAAVMVSEFNSVYSRLRDQQPALLLIKCVCHSLDLACSKAAEKMPTTLVFLVDETYNWFSRSTTRQQHFRDVSVYWLLRATLHLKMIVQFRSRFISCRQV